jgi:hypothetical protein
MYQLFTKEMIPGILITTNFLTTGLKNAGYFFSENLGGTGTTITAPPSGANSGTNN